jgi:osmotically-inducible protein OsmY/sporulation protein YlmC with PRC-barrel domain
VVLAAGTVVIGRDGPLGRVQLVVVDPATRRVTHLVVRRRWPGGRPVRAPVAWVSELGPRRVKLAATRAQLGRLPVYRPDDEIAAAVRQSLWREDALRWLLLPVLRVSARDGVVTLDGHAVSRTQAARAEALARRAPGVVAVGNELVVDGDLAVAVARALADEPRIPPYRVRVEAHQGVVRLTGEAPATARTLAETVAASVPAVRAVVNRLAGPGAPPRPARVLLPRIGLPVYATDGELGRLDGVVLSRRTRRVTHLIVAGHLPDPGADTPHAWDARWGPRTVVVPAAAVGTATGRAVVLRLDLATAARLTGRLPAGAATPPAGWRPPFPYRPAEVVLAPETAGTAQPGAPRHLPRAGARHRP